MRPTESPQYEMNLPDESRHYVLTMENLRCKCGCSPFLMRRKVGHNRWEFRVKCGNQWDAMYRSGHSGIVVIETCSEIEPTPWLNSSDQAIQHWRLAKVLGET